MVWDLKQGFCHFHACSSISSEWNPPLPVDIAPSNFSLLQFCFFRSFPIRLWQRSLYSDVNLGVSLLLREGCFLFALHFLYECLGCPGDGFGVHFCNITCHRMFRLVGVTNSVVYGVLVRIPSGFFLAGWRHSHVRVDIGTI